MSVEIIRFSTNVREEMSFTHLDGNESEGRFGTQYYRGTTDGRGVYLQPIVERKLLELDIKPGELVSIGKIEVKDGRKKGIQWEVKRVDAPGDPSQAIQNTKPPAQNSVASTPQSPKPAATTGIHQRPALSPDKSNMRASPTSTIPAQSKPNSPSQNSNTDEGPPKKPATQETEVTAAPGRSIMHTQMSTMLKGCLLTAIDAARDAQAHATQVGFPLTFGPGEVQAMAISIFIHLSRNGLQDSRPRSSEYALEPVKGLRQ